MKKILLLTFISIVLSNTADHLIFSRVSIGPNQAEMVEIYNPTLYDINLNEPGVGAYYLTDGTEPAQHSYYYNITTGQNYWSEKYTRLYCLRRYLQ